MSILCRKRGSSDLKHKQIRNPRGLKLAEALGRYDREQNVIPLAEAIRKMSLMPAQRLERSVPQMARKGRLSPGSDADVVVFDAGAVGDRATFADPAQRSAGMRYVVVSGRLVVDDGRLVEGEPAGPVKCRILCTSLGEPVNADEAFGIRVS